MTRSTRIAACQINVALGDKAKNGAVMADRLAAAATKGAQLVGFPECSLTGYALASRDEVEELAEPATGPNIKMLQEAAADCNVLACFGFIESAGHNLFNSAILVGRGGPWPVYRKVHLPFMGLDRFVDSGDTGFRVLDVPFGRLGLTICYDQSFPESARILALDGAQLVVLLTNWAEGARDVCEVLTNARALENRIFYMTVDRVGEERGTRFIGTSRIVDCLGRTLEEASGTEEDIILADVDLRAADEKRVVIVAGEHEVDRINDRQPAHYGRLTERGPNGEG